MPDMSDRCMTKLVLVLMYVMDLMVSHSTFCKSCPSFNALFLDVFINIL